MEEVEGVIDKERRRAMEALDRALESSLEMIKSEKEKAMREGESLWEESRRELSRMRSSMISQQELESRKLYYNEEDGLQEKLIGEALDEILHSQGYQGILDSIFKRAIASFGKNVEALYGKDDKDIIEKLAERYGIKVKGEANFSRGFALERGDMMASYSIYDMVNEIKKNLKREIIKEVSGAAGQG